MRVSIVKDGGRRNVRSRIDHCSKNRINGVVVNVDLNERNIHTNTDTGEQSNKKTNGREGGRVTIGIFVLLSTLI